MVFVSAPRRCALNQLSTSMARSHQQETTPFHSSRPLTIAKSVTAMLVSVVYARWDGGVEEIL
jgi:hypothetical protein